jgi:GH25 family lysozyme M1 (1,4-beta-N-acetylmuramidase)
MVEVDSGYGTKMWTKLYDDVEKSTWDAKLFKRDGEFISYTGDDASAWRGIDVSEHQGVIDWEAVAAEGINFAIIRAGYRGYSEGGLFEDAYFQYNMNGTAENGIAVGLYFFSQAVSVEEAEEEAEFLIEHISRYNSECFELPIFYDWESISVADARTDGITGEAVTDFAVAFCEKMKEAGYTVGVYAYRYLAYFCYDLSQLTDYVLWIGAVGDYPDFYYKHSVWQFTDQGKVAGIDGDVDLNLLLVEDGPAEDTGVMAYEVTEENSTAEVETDK